MDIFDVVNQIGFKGELYDFVAKIQKKKIKFEGQPALGLCEYAHTVDRGLPTGIVTITWKGHESLADVVDTVAHELTHVWQFQNGKNAKHGKQFYAKLRKVMDRLKNSPEFNQILKGY